MDNKIMLLQAIDLRNGNHIGKPVEVHKEELWMRSDSQCRQAIKKAGAKASGNHKDIRVGADAVGFENVGFKREWK